MYATRRNTLAALALAAALAGPGTAGATTLSDTWAAARQHDRELAAAQAALATAQPRRAQAEALWRPQVAATATAGLATHESTARNAQFSAPGLGQSTGVGFATSVTNGGSTRVALMASQPLYDPARRAQQRQLALSVEMAELQWQAARQSVMLRTAERYFELALAQEQQRVLQGQLQAVERAATEAKDRFRMGAAPITDSHEAAARLAGLRAQALAAERTLQLRRQALADSTGLPAAALGAALPAEAASTLPSDAASTLPAPAALQAWLDQAEADNPGIRLQRLAVENARQEAARHAPGAAPTVDLVAQASRERLSGSGDFGHASNTGVQHLIGVQVSLPLYSGGGRSARHDEALRRIEQADAEAAHTRQQVTQQVRAAWLGLEVGALRVQALAEALAASASRADATRTGHQVGHRTTLDLLNAENDSAEARLALAQARVALLLDRLRLAALAGRLDEAQLRTADAALAP